MRPKKAITISIMVIVLLFVYYSIGAAPIISDENYTYISGLTWHNTYEAGIQDAREENKPLLVYFWAIWCQYCRKLHEEVYPDEEVSKILEEDFVLVAIDLDTNNRAAQRFGVQYPPHLLFLTPEEETITRIPGYLPKEELLPILENIKEQTATIQSQDDRTTTEDTGR